MLSVCLGSRIRCSPPRLLIGLVNTGAVLAAPAVRGLPLPVARQLQPAPIPCYSCPAQGLGLGRAVRGPLSLRGGTRPSLSGNAETPLQR